MDLPEVQEAVAAMRRVADAYPGQRLLIGEAYLPIDRLMAYYGVDLSGFQLPFNFHLLSTPWEAQAVAALVGQYEAALPAGAWPNWVLGNHDRSRVASRIGPEQARVAAMLLLTLRGTPTIYQGEEIGMRDVPIPPERVQDPWERRVPGLGLGRDPVRTPMPWDGSPQAGFTTAAEPWLPLGADHQRVNVAAQAAEPCSMLALYRALLRLRRAEPALSVGSFTPLASAQGAAFGYERQDPATGRRLWVLLNFGPHPLEIEMPPAAGRLMLSTHPDRLAEAVHGSAIGLRPHEGILLGPGAAPSG
jgi:alpha-glucosidase